MLERLSPRPGARAAAEARRARPGQRARQDARPRREGPGQALRRRADRSRFEGGQMPLVRRLPKRGFRARTKDVAEVVNVGDLAGFAEGATVDAAALQARGLIRGRGAPVKLLGDGDAPRQASS